MKNHSTKQGLFPRKMYLPGAFLLLIAMDVVFRVLYYQKGGKEPWNLTALCFTGCWALLLCATAELFPAKIRRVILGVILAVACSMPIVHGAMYRNFGSFFSFADLAYVEDGARFFSLTYLKIRKAQIVASVLGLAVMVWLCRMIPAEKYGWYRPVLCLLVIVVSVLGLYTLDGRMKEPEDPKDQVFTWETVINNNSAQKLYTDFTNTLRCMQLTGSYQYLYRSFVVTYGIEDSLKNGEIYERLDTYYGESAKNDHPDNEMTGIFAGKNLLLVLLESVDSWMLTEEYMPNLYALQQNGINFAEHYSPMFISGATFGSEFTVNTGLPAPTTGITNRAYTDYAFPYSLANLFKEAGYTANSFHSASPNIYNRNLTHLNWGYEAYHSGSDMGMDDYMRDSELIRGYDQMVTEKPYFSFLLTYSGHGPYTEEMDNISEGHWEAVYEAVDPDQVIATGADLEEYYRAIAHAMETDAFIGELVDALEADGHINDTVLVFFTDHYCKYLSNREFVMELKDAENTDFLCKTPFFIYSSDLPAQTIMKPTATMDIFPTLVNLFGLDVNYAYFPGDDIFGDGGGYVVFRDFNWYDGETYYSVDNAGELTPEIQERNAEIAEKMTAAWDTLRCNYFARER